MIAWVFGGRMLEDYRTTMIVIFGEHCHGRYSSSFTVLLAFNQ